MKILEIEKSKFIGYAKIVESTQDVEQFWAILLKEHKKATHICFAYKITKGVEIVKYSDNGEPQGTAGRPILSVIEKKKLTNVLVCVVRYFGGKKLGAGGLVRAYTKVASLALGELDENKWNG